MAQRDPRQIYLEAREADLSKREIAIQREREALNRDKEAFERIILMEWAIKTTPPREESADSIAAFVEAAIKEVGKSGERFASPEIADYLKGLKGDNAPSFDVDTNRSNISTGLRKALDAGLIEEVSPHKGRTPAYYVLSKN